MSLALKAKAQDKTITGTVTDNTGAPVIGANVIVKGKNIAAVTDLNGKYSIKAVEGDVVIFSFMGYKSQEIVIANQDIINVPLEEELSQLDEIVVIGYGVQKKSDLTGSVSSVKAEELSKMPAANMQTALQGRAAGVQINANNGAPGSPVTMRVRGISSLNGGFPLWIVDGIGADPNSVNPNDIESIEILKDGASAAIYGSSGANGVVLVTTKKGKSGKIEANLNVYHGWQNSPNRINVANGPEFAKMYTEYQAILKKKDFKFTDFANTPSYNYQDMIFRSGNDAPFDNVDF